MVRSLLQQPSLPYLESCHVNCGMSSLSTGFFVTPPGFSLGPNPSPTSFPTWCQLSSLEWEICVHPPPWCLLSWPTALFFFPGTAPFLCPVQGLRQSSHVTQVSYKTKQKKNVIIENIPVKFIVPGSPRLSYKTSLQKMIVESE